MLESQICQFLRDLSLPDIIYRWLLRQLAASSATRKHDREMNIKALQHSIQDTGSQISTLTDLRVRGLITDGEFTEKRVALQKNLYRLQQAMQLASKGKNTIEPEQFLLFFSNQAISWFQHGDTDARRALLRVVSSNLFLKDKILNIQAKKPFVRIAEIHEKTRLLADLDDVRTHPEMWQRDAFPALTGSLSAFRSSMRNENLDATLADIKALMRMFRVDLPLLQG